jgi:hypothetical protein
VSHQLEIGPVVAGNILDAIGELLPSGKQLLQVAKAARHGFASRVDDFGIRHHEMDEKFLRALDLRVGGEDLLDKS